jgi:excisionase family DNA binding protein
MTVREVAEKLQVAKTTVYDLCAKGLLAHHRVGIGRGTIRIVESDLQAYLDSCRVEATGPPEKEEPRYRAGAMKKSTYLFASERRALAKAEAERAARKKAQRRKSTDEPRR